MKKIKVVTLCSGYDAQCLALDRLKRNYIDFDYELVAWAEVDKYAIQAHNALFPQWKDRNMGDITSCDWSKIKDNIDLLTYSTPCQSISSAGKQDGLKKGSGTASSIIWSVLNAIDVLRPKYLLMENVKALVSSKFIGDFHEWRSELSKRGYFNFAKVLNSKCYSIPQNRERIFMVSILDENANYHFPEPLPLDKRLKDVLEEEVDERYYLKTNQIEYIYSTSKNGIKRQGAHEVEDVASAVLSSCYKGNNMNCVKEPIACAMRGREVYGSKHVNNLIESGKIPADEVAFLDGYNQTVHTDVTATIKTNIDKENLMFVSIPQCLTPKRTEYGKKVRKEYESGELKESRHNMQQLEPRTDGVCNTITSVQKDCLIIEPKILSYTRDANGKVVDRHFKDVANTIHGGTGGGGNTDSFVVVPKIIQVANISEEKSFSNPQTGRIYSSEGLCPTLDTMHGGGRQPKIVERYRIRKLTERECFRLMDVDDADIDKIQAAGISKSQQYKMAGNSICTGVLFHIFRKLFVDKENENKQLTLF